MKKFAFLIMCVFSCSIVLAQAPPSTGKYDKEQPPKVGKHQPDPPPANLGPKKGESKKDAVPPTKEQRRNLSDYEPGIHRAAWVEKTFSVLVGIEKRTAYLVANTVFRAKNKIVLGFYWMKPGGDPFLIFDGKTFGEVFADRSTWKREVTPKMLAAIDAGRKAGLVMPSNEIAAAQLNDPSAWQDDYIRDGDQFAMGVAGSPSDRTENIKGDVKYPGHGPTDDFTIYLNMQFKASGKRIHAKRTTIQWEVNGEILERDVWIAESCFNGPLFGHVRHKPKVTTAKKTDKNEKPVKVTEQTPPPPPTEVVEDEPPQTEDNVDEVKPHEEFDVRSSGWSLGGQIFTSASTGAKVDSKGNLQTDKMKFVQYAAVADAYGVKQLSSDPRNDRSYLRCYFALGGKYLTNRTEASDEQAGAGTGPMAIAQLEYVTKIGDSNTDLIGRVTGQFNSNSNLSATFVQAAVEARPRKGRGLGGSLSYSDSSVDLKESDDVSGKILDGRVFYQMDKDGQHTPLPGGGAKSVYIGYDDQTYTSAFWESHQYGPKIGVQMLFPVNMWRQGDTVDHQIAPFVFVEAYGQRAHVVGKNMFGETTVDDDVNQFHAFAGLRLEF